MKRQRNTRYFLRKTILYFKFKQCFVGCILRTNVELKAYNKSIKVLTEYSNKYPTEGISTLTDGSKGEADYHFNWLGFEANELEAIIDLQNEEEISSIRTDFLQEIKSWVWLPKKVEYFVSGDGKEFKKVGEVVKVANEKQPEAFIESFVCNFEKVKTRFVKVKTNSLLYCPKWHFGHNYLGGKAWIFIDEIVIN